jgi:hypothetical protein
VHSRLFGKAITGDRFQKSNSKAKCLKALQQQKLKQIVEDNANEFYMYRPELIKELKWHLCVETKGIISI